MLSSHVGLINAAAAISRALSESDLDVALR
jgi:hypothetical protein